MSDLVIWINSEEAKLFHITSDTIHVERVLAEEPFMPSGDLGSAQVRSPSEEHTFFRLLAMKLQNSNFKRILLMGPFLCAPYFSKYLENAYPVLFEKVIGVEKVGNMPDSEILSVGRQFLQKYYRKNAV